MSRANSHSRSINIIWAERGLTLEAMCTAVLVSITVMYFYRLFNRWLQKEQNFGFIVSCPNTQVIFKPLFSKNIC